MFKTIIGVAGLFLYAAGKLMLGLKQSRCSKRKRLTILQEVKKGQRLQETLRPGIP